MKDVERLTSLDDLKNNAVEHSRDMNFFNPPLSDFEIIKFQNLLMAPSVHYITTKNVTTGRYLMNLFLSAFKKYHNVGCLAMTHNQQLFDYVFDLSKLQRPDISFLDAIELFCIENPYLNFVWIEVSQKLREQFSETQIQKICELFSSDLQTPVIVMEYEQELG